MKILVTGAGGLLGRCVAAAMEKQGHDVIAARHRARFDGDCTLDILDRAVVRHFVAATAPDWIVNCAAHRSPDYCVEHPDEAYRLNTLAVEYLAEAARASGSGLCQISSDYVFSGVTPPYAEDAPTSPVILYGRTKAAAEQACRSAARHLILRIPALYRLDLADPANVLTSFSRTLAAGGRLLLDRATVRYYTLADDVAAALIFLLERQVTGIIHLSAKEASTKGDLAEALALRLGFSTDGIVAPSATTDLTNRPLNTRLATSRYDTLQGPGMSPLSSNVSRLPRLQYT